MPYIGIDFAVVEVVDQALHCYWAQCPLLTQVDNLSTRHVEISSWCGLAVVEY